MYCYVQVDFEQAKASVIGFLLSGHSAGFGYIYGCLLLSIVLDMCLRGYYI
jgi:hypothetical protein